jgi:hypothetical protein
MEAFVEEGYNGFSSAEAAEEPDSRAVTAVSFLSKNVGDDITGTVAWTRWSLVSSSSSPQSMVSHRSSPISIEMLFDVNKLKSLAYFFMNEQRRCGRQTFYYDWKSKSACSFEKRMSVNDRMEQGSGFTHIQTRCDRELQ